MLGSAAVAPRRPAGGRRPVTDVSPGADCGDGAAGRRARGLGMGVRHRRQGGCCGENRRKQQGLGRVGHDRLRLQPPCRPRAPRRQTSRCRGLRHSRRTCRRARATDGAPARGAHACASRHGPARRFRHVQNCTPATVVAQSPAPTGLPPIDCWRMLAAVHERQGQADADDLGGRDGAVEIIDQTALPHAFVVRPLRTARRGRARDRVDAGARRAADRRGGGLRDLAGDARRSVRRRARRRARAALLGDAADRREPALGAGQRGRAPRRRCRPTRGPPRRAPPPTRSPTRTSPSTARSARTRTR